MRRFFAPERHGDAPGWGILLGIGLLAALLVGGMPGNSLGQTFDSGSDGSDGALNLSAAGTIVFDPEELGLDADGDGIYHFTTINIASGVTVRLGADIMGSKPVVWLATGDVQIDGTLDLNGEDGHYYSEPHISAIAGAGGFNGGIGASTVNRAA